MKPNQGIAPPNLTSPVGLVRLELGDTNPTNVDETVGMGEYLWYSDEEIEALLKLYGDDPRSTAVRILRNIAITPSLKLRKWRSADLQVDGPAITDALLKAADRIEGAILNEASAASSDVFLVIETGAPDWTAEALLGRAYGRETTWI